MYSSKMKKTVCIMLLCLLTVACAITSACTGGATAVQDKTVSISAVFEQTDVVYEGASLETLKPMLTVNKVTQSGKTGTVTRYILTGELVEGDSVITVILQGDRSITTTFTVLVTAEDHVHVYGDWYSVKRPTCVEEGKEERACACGSREERAIALVEHTPGVAVRENSVSNTCTENGSYDMAVYCTVCDKELSREHHVIDATGHAPKAEVEENRVNPTCVNVGGYDTVVYCGNCNEELSREHHVVEANGHSPKAAVEENRVHATCVKEGGYDTVVYCGVCKAELSREHTVVEANGHSPKAAVEENNSHPTCLKEGGYDTVVYCGVCKVELSREHTVLDALGHEFSVVNGVHKHATCLENREDIFKCIRCKETEVREIENTALGHSPKAAVEENQVAPTCTKDGSYDLVVYCGTCNAELSREEQILPAKGHSPKAAVEENQVAPTCTADGSYDLVVYCGTCNAELSREEQILPAKGHSPKAAVEENQVAPTCTKDGSYDLVVYCATCNAELSREEQILPAKGHSEMPAVEENQVAPTCTKDGSYDLVVYCATCNAEISREHHVVTALGHQTNGLKDCARCGLAETSVVFEFGANGTASHNDGSDLGASKSYTQDGYTLALTAMSKVYGSARDAMGNSCIKLGTSSTIGTFTFTAPAGVNKVVINVAQYKANTTKISVNGKEYTITTASNNGDYTPIEVDTTANKTVVFKTVSGGARAMVNSIEYHAEIEKSDATKLEEEVTKLPITANKTLEADYSVTLPTIGKLYNGVEISWQLSSTTGATLNNNLLTVKRLIPQDNIATVHVVLSLNNEKVEKSYIITVERYVKLTIAQFNAYASTFANNAYSTNKYEITGTITSIANTTYGNMYIEDENGDKAYVYGLYSEDGSVRYDAMANKPVVGDKVTVSTVAGAYAGKPQGKSAWLINCVHEHDFTNGNCACGEKDPNAEEPELLDTPEKIVNAAYALEEGATLGTYTLTGIVIEHTEYNAQYNNLTVVIVVGDMTDKPITCFRIKGSEIANVKVGDTITVTGLIKNYYGTIEFDAGSTLDSLVVGETPEEPEQPSAETATISFADTANRTEFSTTKQVWVQNGITVTGNKASSTSNVGDYANPARFYKGSTIIISTEKNIEKIVITCSGGSKYYLTSATVTGGTLTSNGATATITCDGTANSVTLSALGNQVRIASIEVTLVAGGSTEPEHTCSFTALKSDATHHWYACVCGEINGKVEHTAKYVKIDAESHKQICSVCELIMEDTTAHDFTNGNCACGQEAPSAEEPKEETATISFASKANRTEFSTAKQVWVQNGITVTNNKASSTSNVGDYANPARFYKSSQLIVAMENTITKIVFTCSGSSYATALKNSITGATVTVSDLKVTVELTTPATSFTIKALTGGQVRIKSIEVTYLA